ncbi:MAG: putative esterase [Planctomycetota bacterium]|jgi:predicted esterase
MNMKNQDNWTSDFSLPTACRLVRPEGECPAKTLLVALHGMGQNAELMTRAVQPLVAADRAILIPDGPLPFEKTVSRGRRKIGRAWYLYTGDQVSFLESARLSGAWLMAQIERAKSELGDDNIPVQLLGYSQGGYLAAILTFDNPGRFDRLVSCCSRMKTEILADEGPEPIPVLVIHGAKDEALPIERARESADDLTKRGWPVDFRAFPDAGHKMELEQWQAVDAWLRTPQD